MDVLPSQLLNETIGLGFLHSDVYVGCDDLKSDNKFPLLAIGDINKPLGLINAYRDYKIFRLDLLKCTNSILIQLWVRDGDIRHGLISGKISVGATPLSEGLKKFIELIINGLFLFFAFAAIPALIIVNWISKNTKSQNHPPNFEILFYHSFISVLYVSGLMQMSFPLYDFQSIYRRIGNIFISNVRLLIVGYFFDKYTKGSQLDKLFKFINKPRLNSRSKNLNHLLTVGFFFSVALMTLTPWYQFNYTYVSLAIGAFFILFGPNKVDAKLVGLISVFSDLKLLNYWWAPEGSTGVFFIFVILIAQLTVLFREQLAKLIHQFADGSEKSRLIASQIYHDIRSPLAVLRLLFEQAEWKNNSNETKEVVKSSIERISLISREELQKSRRFSSPASVNDIESIINEQVGRSVIPKLIISSEAVDTDLKIDKTLFFRVLQNLLNNAFEVESVSSIKIEVIKLSQMVQVLIANDGVLPSRTMLQELLSKGGTHNKLEGTGIGLKFCQNVINDTGGSLNIHLEKRLFVVAIQIPIHNSR